MNTETIPDVLVIRNPPSNPEPFVRITPEGKVILREDTDLDEAARLFWAAIERNMPDSLKRP